MRKFFIALFSVTLLCAVGCGTAKEGTPVATEQDEFEAYDALVAGMEEETASEEAADGE